MKNNTFYFFFLITLFLSFKLTAQDLEINSSKIKYDNKAKITIFEGNVSSNDEKGNKLFSEYAEYNKLDKKIKTSGKTEIITSNGYEVVSANVIFDNKKKTISSNYKTQIKDKDGNKILVDMFNYSTSTNIFFSKGNIKIFDVNNNDYSFSEIYIDENKKKIIGSDVRAFLKDDKISIDSNNDPRLFANTMSLSENLNTLEKGVFTYCKIREDGKCPPWTLQSKKIKHDLAKKTIYYENVVLKVYDFPIFYSPRFSHPDPSVKRMSGLLAPVLTNSNTIGSGLSVPYFWNIANDRDLTLAPKLYLNENPLMLAEYRQDFKKSFLLIDAGYTQGYKKKTNKKTDGGRAHFFTRFNMSLLETEEKESNLEVKYQKVSNDTYFKIYDIKSSLVDKNINILEKSIDLSYQNNDFYFNLMPSAFEDINKKGNLRHEYLFPLTVEKNIFSDEKYGIVDLESNLKIRNFDTNKQSKFFINNFNWVSNKWLNKLGFENHFKAQIKTVNYEAEKIKAHKDGANTELKSAVGYFTKLALFKNDPVTNNLYTFTPKLLLRYAPGQMRNIEGSRLNYGNLFSLNKVNQPDVIQTGLSSSIGFEYKKNKLNEEENVTKEVFSVSAGQVVSEKENMDVPSSSSMDQKFSDIVGEVAYNLNKKVNLNYNFSIDQSYKEFNYNEIGAELNLNNTKFNIDYLQEKNHVGNQEHAQLGTNFKLNNSSELSFSTKRNLLTSSAEFYNLSYNYFNDCLKAGIAYRREFYTDRDIEPENRLMFTISIIPFSQITTPGLN